MLTVAIAAIQSKELTVAQATRPYEVPYCTLRDNIKRISKYIGSGRPTVLTRAERQEIVVTFQI